MKQFNFQKGQTGEGIASAYLRSRGFKIIEKNFSTRFGEIDLIGIHANKIVFVEVKLKIGETFGTPEEMVTHRKLMQVFTTAQSFLQKNAELANQYPERQIDVVAIVLDKDGAVHRLDHYESVEL